MNGPAGWRHPHPGGQLAPDRDPAFHQRLVRSGRDAELCYLPVPDGLEPTLTETERCARTLGEQVDPPGRRMCQLGDRRGVSPAVDCGP